MKKTLHFVSKITFNVFAIVFGLVMLLSVVAMDLEGLITTQIFGGYKTQVITEGEEGEVQYFESKYNRVAEVKAANNNISIAAESEGAVLLKNDDVGGNPALPLAKGNKVSLFSVTSADPIYGIGGAGGISIDEEGKLSYKHVLEDAGLEVNPALYDWYSANPKYFRSHPGGNGALAVINDAKWDELPAAKTDGAYGDAAIFVLGRWGNEAIDMPPINLGADSGKAGLTDNDYLKLTPNEITVLKGLQAAKVEGIFKRIIVLINSANPIVEDFADNDTYDIDACLWIGTPGTGGLYAVGDILTGRVTPSGRLSDMWFSDKTYNPTTANYGNFGYGSRKYVVYQEGIYLGYRYAETRYEDKVLGRALVGDFDYATQISYPFGFGLSYGNFEYSDFDVTPPTEDDDEYTVTLKVTNTGSMPGKEVVQIYLQQPYTQYDIDKNIEKSAVELVGFAKTKKLAVNEEEIVTIKVEGKYFASYDAWGKGTYYVDEGSYYLTAGKDSHDAINNILAAKGKTTADGMNKNGNAALTKLITKGALNELDYKNASLTGQEIVNLFDHSDPNRVDDELNHIKYYSRNNWEGTVSPNAAKIVKSANTDKGYAYDNDRGLEKDTIAYPTYGKDAGLSLINMRVDLEGKKIPYNDPRWDTFLDQLSWEDTVTLLSNGLRQTRAVDSVNKPATVDHNGSSGFNQKFSTGPRGLANLKKDPDRNTYPTGYPCSGIIASTFNTKLAEVVGEAIGEDSLWSGQSGLYGLGLNLHRSPYHGRYAEYYSEDAFLTGVISGYQTRGIQSKGCYVYNKHFVLNDQETNRTSYETWITEQTLRQNHLRPFEIAIDIGNGMNVMTAFNRIGSYWAGNVKNLCTTYLRGECGMEGFAITDWYQSGGMGMAGGVLAGNDLPDGPSKSFEGKETGYGAIANAMRDSVHRIMYTVVHSNAMNGIGVNTRIVSLEPEWIGILNIIKITTIVVFSVSAAFLIGTTAWLVVDKVKAKRKKLPN